MSESQSKIISALADIINDLALLVPFFVLPIICYLTTSKDEDILSAIYKVLESAHGSGTIIIPINVILLGYVSKNLGTRKPSLLTIIVILCILLFLGYGFMLFEKNSGNAAEPFVVIIISILYFILAVYQVRETDKNNVLSWDANS